ncbi:aldose 1-epimerase family protein [Parablautia intestinalis]|jgi:galactose mutarotase-like enzyme|uniref:aldose 1-epimerase family protein n=1 Tax=Parablautia intestinalis TaxID=2320100 RepID=UPI0023D741A9|nr:aldose 1-epimerase family protein [Parablautia intestinalis]MCI8613733.1 aldose 1-epimerase family protein [Lachnospiraceae bacterium]MDE7046475.1 aldose 1-epimerase family protein [Lachnospiraceae bacterium]
MAVYELKNDGVEIKVHSKGAELKSLKNPVTGTEYLWQGDPAFWNRSSPILFPFVGKTDRNEFRTKGKTYSMTQHGFARDMEFELLSRTEDEIWFVLKDSEETRQKYPYGFTLKLGYRLFDNGVEVCWQVENEEEEELPFSIGGHPAFYCPIEEGTAQTDYLLRFDCKDRVVCTRISDEGLALNEEDVYPLKDGFLPITEHLFDHDALVIENRQAKEVAFCRKDGTAYLTVKMEAPLFGVWSPPTKNAPFICIEPWYGRCDRAGYEGDLKDREWGNLLAPGGVWKASYRILIG